MVSSGSAGGPLTTASPNVIKILIWVFWVVLVLPAYVLVFLQRRRMPKVKGSFWSALLYAIVMLGGLGTGLTFWSAFNGGKDVRAYMMIEWSAGTRYYLYIHHSVTTYVLFVIQLIALEHLRIHVAKHKDVVMNVSAAHPQGRGSGSNITITVLYILSYLLTIGGFISSVCLDVWYCSEPNWTTTIRNPVRCPVWWSWTPWLAMGLCHLFAWVTLLAAVIVAGKKFKRGKTAAELGREPRQVPLAIGAGLAVVAVLLGVVRVAMGGAAVGKVDHTATYGTWNDVGLDKAFLSFEVLILSAAVMVVELRKGLGKGERQGIEMYNVVPEGSGGLVQPPPVYSQQGPGGGPPVYQMPPAPPRY